MIAPKEKKNRIHTCDSCGKNGVWTKKWSICGPEVTMEKLGYCLKACSVECKKAISKDAQTRWKVKYGESVTSSLIKANGMTE